MKQLYHLKLRKDHALDNKKKVFIAMKHQVGIYLKHGITNQSNIKYGLNIMT